MTMSVSLLFKTLRYLKPGQIGHRLLFALKKTIFKPFIVRKIRKHRPGQLPEQLFLKHKPFSATAKQNLLAQTFCFLNIKQTYPDQIQWNDRTKSKLWLYNLHYFEYLLPLTHEVNENHFEMARRIIENWLQKVPIGSENAWEPYPISLRVVNWIFFYDAYFPFFMKHENFNKAFLDSLFQQISYLNHFLEKHLLANHFWANVKALLAGALFFNETRWLQKALQWVQDELNEQILRDGGHYERSPMYHALILTDVLDLIQLIEAKEKALQELNQDLLKLKQQLLAKTAQMEYWLQAITQPDGQLPLLGDTALAIAPSTEEIRQYFVAVVGKHTQASAKYQCLAFNQSGYFVFKDAQRYLLIDGGKLGVSYQPGHAHCDFLSYVFAFKGLPFIVDSGLGEYLPTELRSKARSVYSHNTLVINGLEQAELWSAFRMGRRIEPEKVVCKTTPNFFFTASYKNELNKRLAYEHRREILVSQTIEIRDYWQAKTLKSVENLIHLHPDCAIELDQGKVTIKRKDVAILLIFDARSIKAELRDWFFVPEFGKILPNKVLVLKPGLNLYSMSYTIQMS